MPSLLAQSGSSSAAAVLFYVFALMSGGSALGVVVSRNIVRTAVCLMFTLLGVAGLYFLLNAEFLAAVQLVVYAGGTLILIVFGVMLTSKSPFSRFEPKLGEAIVAGTIAAVLLMALVLGINQYVAANPGAASANDLSAPMAGGGYPVDKLGLALLGDYLVPFELASVLLLVVMIGAAYLAKGRRREGEEPTAVTRTGVERPSTGLSSQARQWS